MSHPSMTRSGPSFGPCSDRSPLTFIAGVGHLRVQPGPRCPVGGGRNDGDGRIGAPASPSPKRERGLGPPHISPPAAVGRGNGAVLRTDPITKSRLSPSPSWAHSVCSLRNMTFSKKKTMAAQNCPLPCILKIMLGSNRSFPPCF